MKRKAEEKTAMTDATVPDDLALMTIVVGVVRYGRVYGAGLEVVHLRVERAVGPHIVED